MTSRTADPPARAEQSTARRVIPLFRPYRLRVVLVGGLIVLTSAIGIINPFLIQAVFNKALFVPGGPKLHLLYVLVAIMAVVPIVNGALGILQVYETTMVGQHGEMADRVHLRALRPGLSADGLLAIEGMPRTRDSDRRPIFFPQGHAEGRLRHCIRAEV